MVRAACNGVARSAATSEFYGEASPTSAFAPSFCPKRIVDLRPLIHEGRTSEFTARNLEHSHLPLFQLPTSSPTTHGYQRDRALVISQHILELEFQASTRLRSNPLPETENLIRPGVRTGERTSTADNPTPSRHQAPHQAPLRHLAPSPHTHRGRASRSDASPVDPSLPRRPCPIILEQSKVSGRSVERTVDSGDMLRVR